MGKREQFALLGLSSWCLVNVVWLFLAVPWVCLQFVIVVFPDHTHLLILQPRKRYILHKFVQFTLIVHKLEQSRAFSLNTFYFTYSTADFKAVRGVYWSDLCNI